METRQLNSLLEAIRLTCTEKTSVDPVLRAYEANQAQAELVSFADYSAFLMQFDFVLPRANKGQLEKPAESPELKAYRERVEAMLQRQTASAATPEFQLAQKKLRESYGNFLPAHQLAHVLPKYFKGENPGTIIGLYMDRMYADPTSDAAPQFSRYTVTDRTLAEAILGIGNACLRADQTYNRKHAALLSRALNYIILARFDAEGFDCDNDCGTFFAAVKEAPAELALKLLSIWGDDGVDSHHLPSLPAFAELLNSIGALDSPANEAVRKLPLYTLNLIHARITDALDENCSANFTADYSTFYDAIPALLERLRDYARHRQGGCTPLTVDAAYAYYDRWEPYIQWTTCDLRAELACAVDQSGVAKLLAWDTFEKGSPPVDIVTRGNVYMRLFDACEEEGFLHLATAVLAYFVFSQAIAHKGNLGPWLAIVKRLERSRQYPGHEMIKQALDVAALLATDRFPLTAIAIQSWRVDAQTQPNSNVVDLSSALTAGGVNRSEFEAEWKNHLGSGWNILCSKSQDHLIDGDWKWSMDFRVFCKGMKSWGGVGLDYAQAIEAELGTRLHWLPTSPLFKDYCHAVGRKPDKHLALGTLVKTLRDKKLLGDRLLADIESAGVRCQNDPTLMKQLSKLVDLRNKAAHPNGFGPQEYTEIKELVFNMMPGFVEALDIRE